MDSESRVMIKDFVTIDQILISCKSLVFLESYKFIISRQETEFEGAERVQEVGSNV